MQARKEQNQHISNFINNTINDLKNLTSALRSLNRHSADVNNIIINKLLLANDRDSLEIIKDILGHLLHIVDLKGMNTLILSILTKVISYIKLIEQEQLKSQQKLFPNAIYSQEMSNIMYHIIDIIFLLKNKNKDFDMILRIIQTTFSLIDTELLKYVNYHIITRIYSICFECSLSNAMIQNISTSALFALTQIIFGGTKIDDICTILTQFLEYLFGNKKFSWIKEQQFKFLVWDLVIIGIRSFPTCQIEVFFHNKSILSLINQMYRISIQKIFSNQDSKSIKNTNTKIKKHQNQKNTNIKKGIYSQFIRYYKSFIFLSIHLSIKPHSYHLQLVPFKQNIYLFKIIYQLQRDIKLYLLLEGISLLIIEGSNLLVEDQRTILLLDIFSKIIEQLCLACIQVQLTSDIKDLYLEKMCGDFNKITDSDFVKLTRNTIIKLRKKFQGKIDKKVKTGQLLTERTELSQKSEPQISESSASSSRKKWQKLINNVIRIIRYLTSLNMKQTLCEQLVRKIIIQLQYWYLICPSVKTRNFILQQLMSTSTLIDHKIHAIKVSQCVQIGSNIIYGYYDSLDAIGLTIILKMMAGVKTIWEDGRGFEELDQVCTMSEKLYIQQNLVHSDKSFSKTIQAFVQCVNSLLSDLEHPNRQQKLKKGGRTSLQKICKMTEYVFGKLEIILDQNVCYINNEWNFLTSFWISLCSNRNIQIKQRTMNHIASVIVIILKKSQIKQELILSTYLQLSKLHLLDISKLVISQLKQILLNINSEQAIIEICRIIKIVLQSKTCKSIVNEVYQLHQMVVKQLIFKIKSTNNLIFIIQSFNSLSQDKNQQYKTVNLIWNISDHLKILAQKEQMSDIQKIWRKLFGKLYLLSLHSVHGETKQSCIHTFTQILAQSTSILKVNQFLSIIKEIYLPVFYVLMSINRQSPKLQNANQFETVKVAIKNIIKMIKKCKNDGIDTQMEILHEILDHITSFIGNIENQVSIQYQYELCTLLQFIKSVQKGKEQSNRKKNIQVLNFIQKMEIHHSCFDQTSLMWRKKYEPAFKELKSYFIN